MAQVQVSGGANRHDGPAERSVSAIRARLHAQAELFDDPRAYQAGVEDALQALEHRPEDPSAATAATPSARPRIDHHAFLRHVREVLGCDHREATRLIQATLECIADLLPRQRTRELARCLPPELGPYVAASPAEAVSEPITSRGLRVRVARRIADDPVDDVGRGVAVVLALVEQAARHGPSSTPRPGGLGPPRDTDAAAPPPDRPSAARPDRDI